MAAVAGNSDIRTAGAGSVAIALSVAAALLAIPQAFLLGDLVALAVLGPGSGLTGLDAVAIVVGLALAGAARSAADAGSVAVATGEAIRFKRALRGRWLGALAAWSPLSGQRASTGEVVSTLVDRVETLDPWFVRYPLARSRMMIVPVAVIAAVLPVSWAVAALLLVAGPVIPVFMSIIGARARDLGRKQIDETAGLTGLLLDRVRGIATLRALGAQDLVAAELARTGERLRKRTMAVLAVAFLSSAVLEFFASVGIALAAVFVGFHLLGWIDYGGNFGLAGGVAVLVLAPEFFQPLRDFAGAYHDRATALSLADRADETFAATVPRMMAATPSATPSVGATGGLDGPPALRIDGLTLEAAGSDRRVLDGVSLQVGAGERVAIVGPSGSGKTTLLLCVAGLVERFSGTVEIGGCPLAAGRPRPAPAAWIGQEPFILHGSVLANLDLSGRAGVSRAAAREALDAVGLADVVARMPRGLATPLGETGAGLSRGELRRVTIARALLSDAGLFLADEPTADLDAETAAAVTEALLAAAAGRTLVVATHDPLLAARMDRVWRLDGGRLVEMPA